MSEYLSPVGQKDHPYPDRKTIDDGYETLTG
jgi:hypothetical protein